MYRMGIRIVLRVAHLYICDWFALISWAYAILFSRCMYIRTYEWMYGQWCVAMHWLLLYVRVYVCMYLYHTDRVAPQQATYLQQANRSRVYLTQIEKQVSSYVRTHVWTYYVPCRRRRSSQLIQLTTNGINRRRRRPNNPPIELASCMCLVSITTQ